MVGFVLMIISSSMFWSARYREIHGFLDKKNRKLFVKVVCKNKGLREQVYAKLAIMTGEVQ